MSNPTNTEPAQIQVANNVTRIVLVGTCILGVLGLSMGIIALIKGNFAEAKDILQILFATILPLFGTWIGTVLAYYFSKENLLAANQTVKHLINTITSSSKLEMVKAREVMIPTDKLIYINYKPGTDDATFDLRSHFLDFIASKGIARVILLDDNKCARYVLHKSTIEGFIAEQYYALQKGVTSGTAVNLPPLTFADLKSKGNTQIQSILKDGVKFIKEDSNLSDAKILIQSYESCNDVFITKNGLQNEPVLGWITDKTIAENSIV